MSERELGRDSEGKDKVSMPHKGGNKTMMILAVLAAAIVAVAAAFATGILSMGSDKEEVIGRLKEKVRDWDKP